MNISLECHRRLRNLDRQQLSEQSGVPYLEIWNIEVGKKTLMTIKGSHLIALANVLQVDVNDLVQSDLEQLCET